MHGMKNFEAIKYFMVLCSTLGSQKSRRHLTA